MRATTLLCAGLLLAAPAAAQHEHAEVRAKFRDAPATQQERHDHHGHHGMTHKIAEGAKLTVADDAASQTLTVRLGPLNLPANSDHIEVAQALDHHLDIPFDGWLIAYHPRLADAAGNTIPGRLLHHVAFWNVSRSDFLCPNKEEHIFGAGGEMNDWPALPGFGYRVARGERIRVNTMFHNPTDTDYPETYIEVRVEYRRAADGVALKSVYPTWFDVQECGDSGYDLTPGTNVTTGRFTLKHAGILLGLGGHLHDYGLKLEVVNATRNEPVATLNSQLDPNGLIQSMPIVTFLERGGYRLNRGERVQVTATYDNRAGRPLPDGAMGIAVGYFLPDDDSEMVAHRREPPPGKK